MRHLTRNWAGFILLASVPTLALAQLSPEETKSAPQATGAGPVAPIPPVVAPQPVPVPVPVPAPLKPVVKPAVKPPVKPAVPAPKKKPFVDGLKPGQFIWEKRAANAKDLRIVAVLDIQRIYVFDGSTLVAFSTMSTGKKGHLTPTGSFKILQKNIDHKSNIYSNAPMPYMQRLTWDGIALHAGHIPGYPASHGCLRLPLAFAKSLYGITKMEQPVMVLADLSSPAPAPAPEPAVEVTPEAKPETAPMTDPEKPAPLG